MLSNQRIGTRNRKEFAVPVLTPESLSIGEAIEENRPHVLRLRQHQRNAMAGGKVDDLVDVGGRDVMRGAAPALDVNDGEGAVIGNLVNAFGIAAAEDVRDKIKRMVVRITGVRSLKFVERCLERQSVNMVLPKLV